MILTGNRIVLPCLAGTAIGLYRGHGVKPIVPGALMKVPRSHSTLVVILQELDVGYAYCGIPTDPRLLTTGVCAVANSTRAPGTFHLGSRGGALGSVGKDKTHKV